MNDILTTFVPAFIGYIVFAVTRFFPPKRGNAFLAMYPEWYSRDDKTWQHVYTYLSKGYLLVASIVFLICIFTYLQHWADGVFVAIVTLIVGFALSHVYVRKKMAGLESVG